MHLASIARCALAGCRDIEGNTLATKHHVTLQAHVSETEENAARMADTRKQTDDWAYYRGTDGAENELGDGLNAAAPDVTAVHCN